MASSSAADARRHIGALPSSPPSALRPAAARAAVAALASARVRAQLTNEGVGGKLRRRAALRKAWTESLSEWSCTYLMTNVGTPTESAGGEERRGAEGVGGVRSGWAGASA